MAEITTSPCTNGYCLPSISQNALSCVILDFCASTAVPPPPSFSNRALSSLAGFKLSSIKASKVCGTSASKTRSCGRLGPATLATTVDMSKLSVSVNTGSSPALRHKPCSLQYASTKAIRSSVRPVKRIYASVTSSTGKKPHVAPYSGAILAIVARSAKGKSARPSP